MQKPTAGHLFSDAGKRLARVLLQVSAGGAVAGWFHALSTALNAIPFRYAHNYAEPVIAAVVLRIPQVPLLYHNFQNEPYLLNPYNPPYLYLSRAAMTFTGAPMAAGRLVSFVAGLAAGVFLFMILRRLGTGRFLSLIFTALFFQMPCVLGQWMTMRPDFTGLALSLGAVFFFLLQERRGTARVGGCYWAGVALSILAVLTKQNFIAGAGCYFLYLAAERRFRDALRLGCVVALGAAVPVVLWNHWTHGDLALNQLMNVKKSFYPALFVRFWKEYLLTYAPLVAAAAGALWTPKKGVHKMLFIYLALTAVSTVTLGKIGADTNYFLEFTAAACIAAGLFFEGIWNRLPASPARWIAAAALPAFVAYFFTLSGGAAGIRTGPDRAEPHPFDKIVAILKKIDGPVLAENMGLLLAAEKPILYEPYEFAQLTYTGLWDEGKILNKLDRKEFSLILLETNLWRAKKTARFTPAFIEHLRRNYRPAKVIAGQIFCVPNGYPGPDQTKL